MVVGLASTLSAQQQKAFQSWESYEMLELQGIDMHQVLRCSFVIKDKAKFKLDKLVKPMAAMGFKNGGSKMDAKRWWEHSFYQDLIWSYSRIDSTEKALKEWAATQGVLYERWEMSSTDPSKTLAAKDKLSKRLRQMPSHQWYPLAKKLYKYGLYEDASVAYEKCADAGIHPDTSYFKMATAMIQLGRPEEAISDLKSAIKANPAYFSAYLNLGGALYERKKYEEALKYYTKAKELSPQDERVYLGMAIIHVELEKLYDARKLCEEGLKINPDNKDLLFQLAMLKIQARLDPCPELKKLKLLGYRVSVDQHIREWCK